MNLDMDMIAPAHGVVFREDPGRIIEAYLKWAKPEMKKKAVIIYETMYESTTKMARAIVEGLSSEDIEVKLYKAESSDFTSIFSEIVDAKAILIGSSTFNNGMIPQISYFLEEAVALKPRNKIGAAFGSYGWGKGAVKKIEARMKEMGAELVEDGLEIQYAPSQDELKICFEYGKTIGKKIQDTCEK
jgi:flavorubredoxin